MRNLQIFILLLVVFTVQAQTYVSPSADAIGLLRYANIPVSHYTGIAAITVPLTQVGGREITIPVGLYYNGSGHKVQDISGSTGLGWSLHAGGMITRVVRGLPDDLTNGYCKPSYTDEEPDLFFFNFLGQSGKFVLDKFGQPLLIPYRKLQITPGICANGSNGMWKIVDENGMVYLFGQTSGARETTSVTDQTGTQSFTSSWLLTKVINPNATESVEFSYTTSSYSNTTHSYVKQKDPCHNDVIEDLTSTTVIHAKNISTITTPSGTIHFSYEGNRKDLPGAVALKSVRVVNNQQQLVTGFSFEYGYFNSGCQTSDCFRLRLDKLYDMRPDPLLTFSYNTTTNLPSRYSKNFDRWGYYNNNTQNSWFPQVVNGDLALLYGYDPNQSYTLSFPGASREPDPTKMKANILTAFTRRGGGSEVFEYEPHSVSNSGTNEIVGGLRIATITTQDGEGNSFTRSFKYVAGPSSTQSSGLLYRRPRYLLGLISSAGEIFRYKLFSHAYLDIFDLNGTYVGYSRVQEIVSGRGRTVYEFTNFDSNPNYVDSTTTEETDLSWERGNPTSIKIYDEANNLLSEQINNYDFTLADKKTLAYERRIPWAWSCSCGFLCTNTGNLNFIKKWRLVSRPFVLEKQTIVTYDPTSVAKKMEKIVEYNHDANTYITNEVIEYDATRSSNKYITKYLLVSDENFGSSYTICYDQFDACEQSCEGDPDRHHCMQQCHIALDNCLNLPPANLDANSLALWHLRNRHQLALPIEHYILIKKGTTSKVISSTMWTYQVEGSGGAQINLKETWNLNEPIEESSFVESHIESNGSFEFDQRMRRIQTYDSYHPSSGILLQQTSHTGIQSGYTWDYNNTLITSATHVAGGQQRVVSSTHRPLVGITSTTDVNGKVMTYEYNDYNLLKLERDEDGNILKRYWYNYRNETPGFRLVTLRNEALVNENIQFGIQDVAVSLGDKLEFLLDFGDGTVIENPNTSLWHQFTTPGIYTVKLVGLNPEYGASTRTIEIGVYDPMSLNICGNGPITLDLCGVQEPFYGFGPCTNDEYDYPTAPVELTATIANGCPSKYTYYWEYKKTAPGHNWLPIGATPEEQTVFFSVPPIEGTYEARCTVTDGCGNTTSAIFIIDRIESGTNCGGIEN